MKYFSANGGLGLGALFNQFYSDKSDGKTFDCKYRALKRFEKNNYVTVYMRRFKNEFDKDMCDTFIDEVLQVKPDEFNWINDIKATRQCLYIKKANENEFRPAIYFLPLTMSAKKKSSYNPLNVREIDFDEYVPMDNRYCYNEMHLLLEAYQTFDRKRNLVKLCTFGNRVTSHNPFLNYFNIQIKIDDKQKTRLYNNGTIMIQVYHNDDNRKEVKSGTFYDMVKNTPYGNYISGNVLNSISLPIRKKNEDARLFCSFISQTGRGSIWKDDINLYICNKFVQSYLIITDKAREINNATCILASHNATVKYFKQKYNMCCLYAEDENAYNKFLPLFKMM